MSLRFGVAAHGMSRSDATALTDFTSSLSRRLFVPVAGVTFDSYDDLAAAVRTAAVDFAWLPPILLIGLEKRGDAAAIVSLRLDAPTMYTAAIITRYDSAIVKPRDLDGARMGWVDRWSASGYVVPRIALAAEGVDPRTAFLEEQFFGSHDALVRAVLASKVDAGATYARASASGAVESGAWSAITSSSAIRVVASWGPVPSDVVATRTSMAPDLTTALRRALLAMARDEEVRVVVKRLFGTGDVQPWVSESYDAVRRAMTDAVKQGLLDELRR